MAVGRAAIHVALDGTILNGDIGVAYIGQEHHLVVVSVPTVPVSTHETATAAKHVAVVVAVGADGAALDEDSGRAARLEAGDTVDSMLFWTHGGKLVNAYRGHRAAAKHAVVDVAAFNSDLGVAIHTAC